MEKINILMLNYEFPPLGGGAGNANYYLLKEFSRYPELEIDLVTSSSGAYQVKRFSDNTTIHYLDIYKKNRNMHYQSNQNLVIFSLKALYYTRKLIRQKKFDLCHAFFGIPCGYLAMKLNLPYIVSLRGSDVPFYNHRFYWLDKLLFRRLSCKIWQRAQEVIANSAGLKALATAACPGQNISIIGNGVDIEEFYPHTTNIKKSHQKLVLISTGRLIERKGYQYLIKAMHGLGNVELRLIGEGNLKNNLEGLAASCNVKVNFLGKVSHHCLPEYLRNADIFVLPSLNEGMSNAILEAMACGLPIITTDTGGSKELIKDNGFIVKKADINELKQAIKLFIQNPELVVQMGKASRRLAEGMSWVKVSAAYREAYYRCKYSNVH